MKKFIAVVILIFFLSFSVSSKLFADALSTSKYVNVSLNVGEVFGFKLADDAEFDQTLDLSNDTTSDDRGELHMLVSTNRNEYWAIRASSSGLTSDQSGYGVPLEMSTLSGEGTMVTNQELSERPLPVYRSAGSELLVSDYLIEAEFGVKGNVVPPAVGVYTGQILLEMETDVAPR